MPRPDLAEPRHFGELLFLPRRLVCGGCGALDEWAPGSRGTGLVGAVPGGSEDPFFRRPLWLQTRCVGQVLWAYNERHVAALAAYVAADLRERGGARPTLAMFARLPRWLTSAGHRPQVLAGLAALRAQAARSAPANRSDAAHERADRPRNHRSLLFRGGAY
ncbi:hypothetical protein OG455_09160 [Kitasatospora sp. NBC_01287]|uniref:hypothetical protein n=1 Tax=Kitasatospora sp. NBC_01287 TaxID=2903573 RepID=UPI00224C8A29|nr:hypothetical protein [Kitasatospora sp. NBC_01287]MCX4745688.1 hypothetical protein [Kitasatospora sp. NBC_01287]